jgi:excinuclease ABC subunit C
VIDGGKGQLSSAVKVLKKYNLKIPVIGLAKQEEEVFIPKKKDSVSFKKDSPAKFLLARIRDEAHRFANRHREGRGEKAAISSALDSVPGIGPRTKKELLKKFGSVDGIKKASDMELESVLSERQIQKLRSI